MKVGVTPYHRGAEEKGVKGTVTSAPHYGHPHSLLSNVTTLHFLAFDTSHIPTSLHFGTRCFFFQMLLPHTPQTGKLLCILQDQIQGAPPFRSRPWLPQPNWGLLLSPEALTPAVFCLFVFKIYLFIFIQLQLFVTPAVLRRWFYQCAGAGGNKH